MPLNKFLHKTNRLQQAGKCLIKACSVFFCRLGICVCLFPENTYLFKVNNWNNGNIWEICWNLTIKTPERRGIFKGGLPQKGWRKFLEDEISKKKLWFSTCAKSSEKWTYSLPPDTLTRTCAHQRVRNVSFWNNFVYVKTSFIHHQGKLSEGLT